MFHNFIGNKISSKSLWQMKDGKADGGISYAFHCAGSED
jgi:hypothetical protein